MTFVEFTDLRGATHLVNPQAVESLKEIPSDGTRVTMKSGFDFEVEDDVATVQAALEAVME